MGRSTRFYHSDSARDERRRAHQRALGESIPIATFTTMMRQALDELERGAGDKRTFAEWTDNLMRRVVQPR